MYKTYLGMTAGVFLFGACGTTSTVGSSSASVSIPPQQIAQCGSPGAPTAEIDYPNGWFERLAASERRETQPSDELLGGPETTTIESDSDIQPLNAPLLSYPADAKAARVEGVCEVLFDSNEAGSPTNITAACSDDLFLQAARSAISGVQVAPRIVDGKPVGRMGVNYPLLFCLED